MPITNDPQNIDAEQSPGVGPTPVKQQQEGTNALEAAAPSPGDELAGLDLSGADTVGPVPFSGFDNDDELLFGPTDRPDELMSHVNARGRVRIPQGLESRLPALLDAARQPGAPQELHNFIRILAYELGQEA